MLRRARFAAAFLAILASVEGVAAADPLADRLDAALAAGALRGGRIAALVVELKSGAERYARRPDVAMVPASNLKILTALGVLSAFGPTHRFVTEVRSDAPPDGDGRVGTLYLRGGGDPGLTSEDFWRLAADLRRAGLRGVEGDLVLDDSAFDAERWHPSWMDVSARAYHAPVGALNVNYGAFAVVVEAGRHPGEPVRAQLDPEVPFLRLVNRARTGPVRAGRSLSLERRDAPHGDELLIRGALPAGREARTLHRSVSDPARYAGAVLRMQLRALGIEVAGVTRRGSAEEAPNALLAYEGPALSDSVQRFLKYSNNSMGEVLLKALGARSQAGIGSWPAGVAALREELATLGVPLEGLRVVDGSGLSYENRISPRQLVAALRVGAESFRFGPEFLAGLPIAALDGTLEERAEAASGRVRAKTGLLTRVTGLSGFAEQEDGTVLLFALLVNGFRGSAESVMRSVDGFAAALLASDSRASTIGESDAGPASGLGPGGG